MGSSVSSVSELFSYPQEGKALRSSYRILCYGDSLTAGFYDYGKRFNPYGEALSQSLASLGIDCEVAMCGMSGHRADQMVAEQDSSFCQDICGKTGQGLAYMLDKDGPFDLVILMAGTNDYTANVSKLPSIKSSVCRLHDACHIRGTPTVMMAPPCNTQNLRKGLSQLLQTWANNQFRVLAFVDPEDVIPRSRSAYWEPDSVHFSPSGSNALGAHLAPIIAQILRQLGEQPVVPMPQPRARHAAMAPAASPVAAPVSARGGPGVMIHQASYPMPTKATNMASRQWMAASATARHRGGA